MNFTKRSNHRFVVLNKLVVQILPNGINLLSPPNDWHENVCSSKYFSECFFDWTRPSSYLMPKLQQQWTNKCEVKIRIGGLAGSWLPMLCWMLLWMLPDSSLQGWIQDLQTLLHKLWSTGCHWSWRFCLLVIRRNLPSCHLTKSQSYVLCLK